MVGTLASAFLKDASVKLAMACKPARINSLFLISMPRPKARFFISPICSNSALGMVKLSRTTLTFLSFNGFAGVEACFFTAGLVAGLTAGFFGTGLVAWVWEGTLVGAAFTGVTAFLRAGAWGLLAVFVLAACVAGAGADVLEVEFMADEF